MKNQLVHEKIKQTVEILNEKNIDAWLIFVRESATMRDPSLELVVGTNCTWQSAFIINRNGDTTAILGSLDVPNMKTVGTYKNVIGFVQSVKEPLLEYLKTHDPKKIALNYSLHANLADGLTHGMFLALSEYLKDTPYVDRFVSSEEIIAALRGRKSASEIELMKVCVHETEKIFDEVTQFLQPGKTEKDVADFIKEKASSRGFEMAWDEDHCPAVFTGPDTAGAHSGPTDRVIERGHILNIDFGVKINGFCSDMQRTWYIAKENETTVPPEVQRGFDVLCESINQAAMIVKPGMQGCEIDDAARNFITQNGYAEYLHGLGHQVGRDAHDGGSGFFPRWERYGNLPFIPIEKDQVYTIEPRLMVEGHGIVTMEEEIVVTENGCRYLSNPQKSLWIIR